MLDIDTASVSAAPVRGSRDDLARVVRNLLDNAERHALSRVAVSSTTTESGVELIVSDDGPGIDSRHRPHVFERFYRGDEARRHDAGSSGLGLAIVAAVTARHGGSVDLAGSGPGAHVVVHLPPA
jgi:signal transduction histidine kinase